MSDVRGPSSFRNNRRQGLKKVSNQDASGAKRTKGEDGKKFTPEPIKRQGPPYDKDMSRNRQQDLLREAVAPLREARLNPVDVEHNPFNVIADMYYDEQAGANSDYATTQFVQAYQALANLADQYDGRPLDAQFQDSVEVVLDALINNPRLGIDSRKFDPATMAQIRVSSLKAKQGINEVATVLRDIQGADSRSAQVIINPFSDLIQGANHAGQSPESRPRSAWHENVPDSVREFWATPMSEDEVIGDVPTASVSDGSNESSQDATFVVAEPVDNPGMDADVVVAQPVDMGRTMRDFRSSGLNDSLVPRAQDRRDNEPMPVVRPVRLQEQSQAGLVSREGDLDIEDVEDESVEQAPLKEVKLPKKTPDMISPDQAFTIGKIIQEADDEDVVIETIEVLQDNQGWVESSEARLVAALWQEFTGTPVELYQRTMEDRLPLSQGDKPKNSAGARQIFLSTSEKQKAGKNKQTNESGNHFEWKGTELPTKGDGFCFWHALWGVPTQETVGDKTLTRIICDDRTREENLNALAKWVNDNPEVVDRLYKDPDGSFLNLTSLLKDSEVSAANLRPSKNEKTKRPQLERAYKIAKSLA